MTRRGALALIDGRLDEAERLIAAASALGERIGEPDTGNVRMSQLLGLVRARAIRTGCAPPPPRRSAGGSACRRTPTPWPPGSSRSPATPTISTPPVGPSTPCSPWTRWRADRSYLWSVFVGEMTTAAVRLRRPCGLRAAARRAGTAHRHLRGERRAGLLHGQQRALGGDAGRRAGPPRRRPPPAAPGPRRAPPARRGRMGGRDRPGAGRARGSSHAARRG